MSKNRDPKIRMYVENGIQKDEQVVRLSDLILPEHFWGMSEEMRNDFLNDCAESFMNQVVAYGAHIVD